MKRPYAPSTVEQRLLNECDGSAGIALHDDAVLVWSKLSAKCQQSRDGVFTRCTMLGYAGRYDEALATAEASPYQEYSETWLWRIECLRRLKRHPESLAVALVAMELFYDNAAVLLATAKAFKDCGDKERSRKVVKLAAKLDRNIKNASKGWWDAPP